MAAWKQSLSAEASHALRLLYISSLLDLVKCFDSVPYDWLIAMARHSGYNLWLLRLSIAAYTLGRVLDVEGCCSMTLVAACGMAAGSVLAIIELRVLLIKFADLTVASSLYCRLALFGDDATIETVATSRLAVQEHIKALDTFIEAVQGARMRFSDTKNVCCASSCALARAVVRR